MLSRKQFDLPGGSICQPAESACPPGLSDGQARPDGSQRYFAGAGAGTAIAQHTPGHMNDATNGFVVFMIGVGIALVGQYVRARRHLDGDDDPDGSNRLDGFIYIAARGEIANCVIASRSGW
ncbi:hypothetical protein [Nocardia sp. NPDC047648]|uniref:hypothetical protein n=1 Tax=Nocardia sp. NPDC047648 TaxID=3155625 RepID=UPI0034067745